MHFCDCGAPPAGVWSECLRLLRELDHSNHGGQHTQLGLVIVMICCCGSGGSMCMPGFGASWGLTDNGMHVGGFVHGAPEAIFAGS